MYQNPGTHLDGRINKDSEWQDMWEKLVYFPTQCYDVPFGLVGSFFISTFAVKLDDIRARKWNAEQVIVFQAVILQRTRLITGAKNICTQIDAQIAAWNYEAFGKLVCDSYTAAMGYLGRAHRNKNADKCRRTF